MVGQPNNTLNLERALESAVQNDDPDAVEIDLEEIPAELMRERLATLGSLSKESGKEELISCLDSTFHTALYLLEDYALFRDLPGEMVRNVHFVLLILENSMKFHDEEFKVYARENAVSLQGGLEQAMVRRRPDFRPPKLDSPIQMPKKSNLDYGQVEKFAEGLSEHFWARISPYHLFDSKSGEDLPFFASHAFGEWFIRRLHRQVLPWLFKKKSVHEVANAIPVEDYKSYLRIRFAHQGNNPAKRLWEKAFDAIINGEDTESPVALFWQDLCKAPEGGQYVPPTEIDLKLFRNLFEWRPVKVRRGLAGFQQVIEQEAKGGNREGSTRDYMCKLARSLAHGTGDLIAVWALHAYPKEFDGEIQDSFFRSMGKSDDERRRYIPYFMRYALNK